MKEELKIEDMDEETVDELASGIMIDVLIKLLLKKKLITQKELTSQLEENRKTVKEFMKKNPNLIEGLREEIREKKELKESMGSYIG